MIKLENQQATANINPDGAWVEDFYINNQPIFYPKTKLFNGVDYKDRGGMHICVPNFGPSSSLVLPQHGFGRNLNWELMQNNKNSVKLRLKGGNFRYEKVTFEIDYQLSPNSLEAKLSVVNDGTSNIRLAPGFHPYFWLNEDEEAISINQQIFELDNLAGTEFIKTNYVELKTSNFTLNMSQNNLSTWAIWTDKLANYVCVEPTFNGNCFLNDKQDREILSSSQTSIFEINITLN